MAKSSISPRVILLALAAILPFAMSSEVSAEFTQLSQTYESMMISRVNNVIAQIGSGVNSVAERVPQTGREYLETAMNVPIVRETITCLGKKWEPLKKHVIEFAEMLIKLISYVQALSVEIRACFVNAARPGAPKVPACIMDVTAMVARASIEYQQRLVLDAVRIFAAANGLVNTLTNCALYNN